MHNWPAVPAGTFLWRNGPTMAAVANIDITITGKGGHGAHPYRTIDPIVVAAHVITALQTIVSRNVEAVEAGVVTIGHINGGQANNVIPETVHMKGTARWFNPAIGDKLEAGVLRIARGISESFGAKAEVTFDRAYPATVNDPEAMALAVTAAQAVSGDARVTPMKHPTMGAEDFAFMLEVKKGSYIMLGAGKTQHDAMPHHPKYDFNDEILTTGASYWATLAEQLLPKV